MSWKVTARAGEADCLSSDPNFTTHSCDFVPPFPHLKNGEISISGLLRITFDRCNANTLTNGSYRSIISYVKCSEPAFFFQN